MYHKNSASFSFRRKGACLIIYIITYKYICSSTDVAILIIMQIVLICDDHYVMMRAAVSFFRLCN